MLNQMLRDVQGMSLMDFFYLRDEVWKAGEGDLRENNTVLLTADRSRVAELRTEADVASLKKDLDGMAAERVVYLGVLLAVLSRLPSAASLSPTQPHPGCSCSHV